MTSGYDAYRMYLAMKKHFNSDTYDFHVYNGKVRVGETAYAKRKDKYFFSKIEKKYKKDLKEYFLANFVNDTNCWVGTMNDDVYVEWKRQNESMTYHFQNDLEYIYDRILEHDLSIFEIFKVEDNQHPHILRWYLSNNVSLTTMAILEKLGLYLSSWKKHLTDPVAEEVIFKIDKYMGFLNIDNVKYKNIIKKMVDKYR